MKKNKILPIFTLLYALSVLLQPVSSVYAKGNYTCPDGSSAESKSKCFDETFYQLNDILYYNPQQSCSSLGTEAPTSVGDVNSDATTKQRIKALLEFFTGKGMTLAGAAAIAGNTEAESTFNPAIIQGGSSAPAASKDGKGKIIPDTIFKPRDGQGFGLAQWTFGGTTLPRQGPLYKKAFSSNKDIIDMDIQLEYLWKELTTSYKTSTYDKIKNATDPREATKIYMVNFEGPRDQSAAAQSSRADRGERIYNDFKSQIADGSGGGVSTTSVSTTDGTSCDVVDAGAGGIGSIDGFTFPLKTTQSKIKNGVDGSKWCFPDTANCHHDYNAADIFAETGTPILAAVGGEVIDKTTDACTNHSTGCNISIMSQLDGKKILFYYTHMSKQATVDKGREVQAGQQIGSVGTNTTAVGTTRHLHIDMLPGDKYSYRPSCSGATCKPYPFINVQQYLMNAFKALPEGAVSV